jgi:hypothetical protein
VLSIAVKDKEFLSLARRNIPALILVKKLPLYEVTLWGGIEECIYIIVLESLVVL